MHTYTYDQYQESLQISSTDTQQHIGGLADANIPSILARSLNLLGR